MDNTQLIVLKNLLNNIEYDIINESSFQKIDNSNKNRYDHANNEWKKSLAQRKQTEAQINAAKTITNDKERKRVTQELKNKLSAAEAKRSKEFNKKNNESQKLQQAGKKINFDEKLDFTLTDIYNDILSEEEAISPEEKSALDTLNNLENRQSKIKSNNQQQEDQIKNDIETQNKRIEEIHDKQNKKKEMKESYEAIPDYRVKNAIEGNYLQRKDNIINIDKRNEIASQAIDRKFNTSQLFRGETGKIIQDYLENRSNKDLNSLKKDTYISRLLFNIKSELRKSNPNKDKLRSYKTRLSSAISHKDYN